MGGKGVYQITANEIKGLTHFREYLKFVFLFVCFSYLLIIHSLWQQFQILICPVFVNS